MRARLAGVRDLTYVPHTELNVNAFITGTTGVDGEYITAYHLEPATFPDGEYERQLNTMVFAIFSNVPMDLTVETPYATLKVPGYDTSRINMYEPMYVYDLSKAPFIPFVDQTGRSYNYKWLWLHTDEPWYVVPKDAKTARCAVVGFSFPHKPPRGGLTAFTGPIRNNSPSGVTMSEDFTPWGERTSPVSEEPDREPTPCPLMPPLKWGVNAFNIPDEEAETDYRNLYLFRAPEIPGYVFKGWYTCDDRTMTPSAPLESLSWYTEKLSKFEDEDPNLYANLLSAVRNGMEQNCSVYGKFTVDYDPLSSSIPAMPEQYTRDVWTVDLLRNSGSSADVHTIYSAYNFAMDNQVLGHVQTMRYFGKFAPRNGVRRFSQNGSEEIRDAMLHSGYNGVARRLDYSKLSSPSQNVVVWSGGSFGHGYPTIHGKTDIWTSEWTDPVIFAEGTRYYVNMLMMKYARAVKATFAIDTAGGSFDDEDPTVGTYVRNYELSADVTDATTPVGELPTVYTTSPYIWIAGWYIGVWHAWIGHPEADVTVTKVTATTEISEDVSIWARWARTFTVEKKPGVVSLENLEGADSRGEYVWSSYYDTYGGNDYTLHVYQRSMTRYYFKMYGDKKYYEGHKIIYGNTVREVDWYEDIIHPGRSGWYEALRRSDGSPISMTGNVIVQFDFVNAPDTEYDVVANLPIVMESSIATASYRIDSGEVQTATADQYGVAWITIPLGSTVKVWGTPVDPADNANYPDEQNSQSFTADGSSEIVNFRFYLRVGSVDIFEIAFDTLFLWSEYLPWAAVSDASKGALVKLSSEHYQDHPGDIYNIHSYYDWAFTLFAHAGMGGVETVYGANVPQSNMIAVEGGVRYALAIEGSCCAWDEASADPYDPWTMVLPKTNDQCSARVVFFDEEGAFLSQSEKVTPAEPSSGGAVLDGIVAPQTATGAQIVFSVNEGHKAQFLAVNFCRSDVYNNITVTGRSYGGMGEGDGDAEAHVVRWWLTRQWWGPNYGTRISMPKASWTGHVFAGWETADGVLIDKDTPILLENLALRSLWVGAPVAVILNAMGGRFYKTVDGEEVVDSNAFYQRRRVGDAFGELPTPRRNDLRVFDGWWTEESGGTRITSSSIVQSSVTLYAHWGAEPSDITHDLIFNTAGGTMNETSRELAEGEMYGYLPKPAKARCQFLGWWTELSGGSEVSETDKMGYYDVTIYAHWSAEATQWGYARYTIKLETNGGEVASSYGALKYNGGIAKALPTAAQVTKSGATFGGWYETEDFSGSAVTEIPASATGTKRYYARWI